MNEFSSLSIAILAGGRGTRLREVVSDRPKALAYVHSRPFLSYLLDQLALLDIKEVVLCTGYLSAHIFSTFGESYRNIRLMYSSEKTQLGTAGALRNALTLLPSELVLIMNGDSYCDVDLSMFHKWHQNKNVSGSIVLVKRAETKRFGQVDLGSRGEIIRFVEKGEREGPGWVNAGIYLLSQSLLGTIPKTEWCHWKKNASPFGLTKVFLRTRAMELSLILELPIRTGLLKSFFPQLKYRVKKIGLEHDL